jgi:hypothetical protein
MTTLPLRIRRRNTADHPVELRFVDMLLMIIASLMFVTILFSVISFFGSGRPDVAPAVATSSVPAALAGQPYQLTLAVKGGDGTYDWQLVAGQLPAGLVLRRDGTIEGTPGELQTSGFSVQVTDGSGRASEARELSLSVRTTGSAAVERVPPRIVSTVMLLDDAVAGQSYEHTFAAESGTPPYRWSSESLPDGLQLTPDGTLAGRPHEGTSTFVVTMTEAGGTTARQEVRLVVREAPESLFWRILGWLKTAITWVAYLLLVIIVGRALWVGLMGHGDIFIEGKTGLLDKLKTGR